MAYLEIVISRVKHSNIKSQHLHDDRHLKRIRNQGEAMSGLQLFCKHIYETMTQKNNRNGIN